MVAKGSGCCGDTDTEPSNDVAETLNGQYLLDMPRWCTDPIMLIIYIAFCLGGLVVLTFAFTNGDDKRILYGTDWSGTTCGSNNDYHQFWPNPVFYQSLGSVCLDSCPGPEYSWNGTTPNATMSMLCTCNAGLTSGLTAAAFNGGGFLPSVGASTDFSKVFDNGTSSFIASKCTAASPKKYFIMSHDEVAAAQSTTAALQFRASHGNGIFDGTPATYSSAYVGYQWFSQTLAAGHAASGQTKYMMPICNYMYSTFMTGNRCIPDSNSLLNLKAYVCGDSASCGFGNYDTYISAANGVLSTGMTDIALSWYVILTSFIIAILLGFFYLYFMEKCALCIIWTGLLVVNIMGLLLSLAFWSYYQTMQDKVNAVPQLSTYDTDVQNSYIVLAFAIIFSVVEAIILCTCICMCKQINTAVHLVELAAECLGDLPVLLFYPILNCILTATFILLWTYVALYLAATGTTTTEAIYGYAEWTYSENATYAFLYWLFGLLWVLEFAMAIGFTCVAFCVCIWFFTKENDKGERDLPESMLYKVVCVVLTKFVGTCAFGSLIIAVIQMLRIIVEYVDQKKKEMTEAGLDPGYLWDFIFCCFRCCLWCLEQCMRWINKYVYVETILRNSWFCTGACQVVKIIVCYADYIAVTKPIAAGLLWFGTASIAMGTGMICAYWTSTIPGINSIMFPTLLCLIIGWFVAGVFIEVFDMTIDTMLLAFCEAKFSNCGDEVLPSCLSRVKDADGKTMSEGMRESSVLRQSKVDGTASEGDGTKLT